MGLHHFQYRRCPFPLLARSRAKEAKSAGRGSSGFSVEDRDECDEDRNERVKGAVIGMRRRRIEKKNSDGGFLVYTVWRLDDM